MKHLIDDYGTHFVTRTEIGGRVRYANEVDLSKVSGSFDLNAYAKLSYSKLGFSASASVNNDYKQSYKNSTSAVSTKITVLGGSPQAVVTLTTDASKENLAAWTSTLSEDDYKNTVVTKVLQCTPIWELLPAQYAERAKELQTYISGGQYEMDMKNQYNYETGVIGEIKDVTALFTAEDEKNGTLVKDLRMDGRTVARACKEFIPQLSTDELSIVLYPVVQNKPKYNLGYFVGNRGHKPCRVCSCASPPYISWLTTPLTPSQGSSPALRSSCSSAG